MFHKSWNFDLTRPNLCKLGDVVQQRKYYDGKYVDPTPQQLKSKYNKLILQYQNQYFVKKCITMPMADSLNNESTNQTNEWEVWETSYILVFAQGGVIGFSEWGLILFIFYFSANSHPEYFCSICFSFLKTEMALHLINFPRSEIHFSSLYIFHSWKDFQFMLNYYLHFPYCVSQLREKENIFFVKTL